MKIFIDEGGHFTPDAGISVLCALVLPHATCDRARDLLVKLSAVWPRKNGELKGGLLAAYHLGQLVDILFNNDGLLFCHAIDVANEDQQAITENRSRQCDGLTQYLPETYPDSFKRQVYALSDTLAKMPNQLYVQFTLLSLLVMNVAAYTAMYFAQRRPDDLGKFEWIIDAKDPKRVSVQEKWWSEALGPLGQTRTERNPMELYRGDGFDYRAFDSAFGTKTKRRKNNKTYEVVDGYDIKALISGSVEFRDSRSDILIQAVDILANYMRRALNGDIADDRVLRVLGRLQIIRTVGEDNFQSFDFATFTDGVQQRKGIGRTSRIMTKAGRSMPLRSWP